MPVDTVAQRGERGFGFFGGDEPIVIRDAPALAVARHSDGRIAVFGVHADTRDLYTSHQLSPGDDFSEWFDLGNHSGAANNLAPAVVPNDDGRLQVFLRNSGTGLSTLVEEDDESWSAWSDFGQVDLQGTPAAVLRSDGLGFVAMATRGTVRTWLEHDARIDAAADALGIHRHTVRSRVAHAQALLGVDLSSFPARAELWAALVAAGA